MPKEKIKTAAPLRAALYIRVSSQEQAIKGLSLEAQQEDLEGYARSQGWIVAGVYVDAAKTARKRMTKRTNFLRMLEDVKHDKIDLILFTRLDRWFRSVADYYKVMEILEAHRCDWKTTQEQYDTSTAGGRLYINLRLSIAQNEADLCGERISAVFDSKIRHGTVVSGKCPSAIAWAMTSVWRSSPSRRPLSATRSSITALPPPSAQPRSTSAKPTV